MHARFLLHDGLPQQAPGSDASTREALHRLGPLPDHPRILDLGCGPGRHSLLLAKETGGHVDAVDLHRPFLEQLEREAAVQGLADRITTRCADFGDLSGLGVPLGSVDLIWSEGAIYHLGFEAGLLRWRRWLHAGGRAGISELTWLGEPETRPSETQRFWELAYPGMGTLASNCHAAERSGYAVLGTFVLPASDWHAYYTPLVARIATLRPQADTDDALAEVLAEASAEIEHHRRFGAHYGYVFYLLDLA